MRRVIIRSLISIAIVFVSASSHGSPWRWLVQKTSGSAHYRAEGTVLLPLKKGLTLQRGATLRTGGNGRVLLSRSGESVFIGPYTLASIATRSGGGMRTTVLLQKGEADLTVRRRSRVHFSVETPYLVAVVKGTKFQVDVFKSSAEVSVQEGRVQVKALKSGYFADVIAGQKATVDAAGNLTITGKGKYAAIRRGLPRNPIVSGGGSLASGGSSIDAGLAVGADGASVSAGASAGGASLGAGASVGSGISAAGSVSTGGPSVGGGVSISGSGLSGSLGIGGR
jgi:hypothetical protein